MRKTRQRVLLAALIVVGTILFPAARLLVLGQQDLERGRASSRRGDDMTAQVFFERSSRTYFPGNKFALEAMNELVELSSKREESGWVQGALAAAESWRSAMIATGADVAQSAMLRQAAKRVVSLRAALGRRWPAGKEPHGDEKIRALARLRQPRNPRAFPAVAGILLLLIAGLSVMKAADGLSRPGSTHRGLSWYGIALVVSSAGLAFLMAA